MRDRWTDNRGKNNISPPLSRRHNKKVNTENQAKYYNMSLGSQSGYPYLP